MHAAAWLFILAAALIVACAAGARVRRHRVRHAAARHRHRAGPRPRRRDPGPIISEVLAPPRPSGVTPAHALADPPARPRHGSWER